MHDEEISRRKDRQIVPSIAFGSIGYLLKGEIGKQNARIGDPPHIPEAIAPFIVGVGRRTCLDPFRRKQRLSLPVSLT
jgi:hypothetical protein